MITKLNARSSPYIEKRRGLILVCLVLIGFSGPVSANCDDSKGNLWINFTCMVQKKMGEIQDIVFDQVSSFTRGQPEMPLLKDSGSKETDSVLRNGKTTVSLAWIGIDAPYHIEIKKVGDNQACWESKQQSNQCSSSNKKIHCVMLPRSNRCHFNPIGSRYQVKITQSDSEIVKYFVIDNSECSHLPKTCEHNSDKDDLLLKKIFWLKREKHCQFEAYQLFTTIPNPSPILQTVKEMLETGTGTNTLELEKSMEAYFKYCSPKNN